MQSFIYFSVYIPTQYSVYMYAVNVTGVDVRGELWVILVYKLHAIIMSDTVKIFWDFRRPRRELDNF